MALYGQGGKRWALTERGREHVQRDASTLTIGPSALGWDGDALTVRIDEVTAPLPARIRGTVRLLPGAPSNRAFELDAKGQHRWWPIAPRARVEVALDKPAVRWSGPAYFDTNSGAVPLERSFVEWDWSRAPLRKGAAVLYEVARRDGSSRAIAIRIDPHGSVEDFEAPPRVRLPATRWRLGRATRADPSHPVRVEQTLEDAPFYARSVLATHLRGEPATAVHESLSLDRFRAPWVQLMVPFRNPRALR